MATGFDKYWQSLTAKNPLLLGSSDLTVKPDKVKALLNQAYERGASDNAATYEAAKKLESLFGKGVFGI